jgi:hypothetical protein
MWANITWKISPYNLKWGIILGFQQVLNKIFNLLRYNAAQSSYISTFRNNLSVTFSKVKQSREN